MEDAFIIRGVEYKLSEWITIKDYCDKHRLSTTSVVSNWIDREIIPANCVLDIPILNGLRLVFDKTYPMKRAKK